MAEKALPKGMTKGKVAGIVVGILAVAVVVLLFASGLIRVAPPAPPAPPPPVEVKELRIVGGEITAATLGFALEGEQLTSPGPVFKVKVGDTVKIVFRNIGGATNEPHAFIITETPGKEGAKPTIVNGASVNIGSGAEPFLVGEGGEITFKATKAGKFVYMCPVPGHFTRGMWAEFIVEE